MTFVVIPAYKAAKHIERTLDALPKGIEVIVGVNGPEDGTSAIVKEYGGVALRRYEEPGKDLTVKSMIHELGEQCYGQPIMILDADTVPVLPTCWLRLMEEKLINNSHDNKGTPRPVAVGGPVYYSGEELGAKAVGFGKSLYRYTMGARLRWLTGIDQETINTPKGRGAQYGPSAALLLQNRADLETVADLNKLYWLGDDRRMAAATMNERGSFHQLLDPRATCLSPISCSYPNIVQTVKILSTEGLSGLQEYVHGDYATRGTKGTRTFDTLAAELTAH